MSFGGQELYASLAEKAAAIGFILMRNHAFVDGNKRIAHAALEVFLLLNGYELKVDVDEQERMFMSLAAGDATREELVIWIEKHMVDYPA